MPHPWHLSRGMVSNFPPTPTAFLSSTNPYTNDALHPLGRMVSLSLHPKNAKVPNAGGDTDQETTGGRECRGRGMGSELLGSERSPTCSGKVELPNGDPYRRLDALIPGPPLLDGLGWTRGPCITSRLTHFHCWLPPS